jgi:hypothetical protein
VRGAKVMDSEILIKKITSSDGTEFSVTKCESNRYHVLAKFPFLTGGDKYKNNFIQYVSTELTDEDTAVGVATFACSCYERGITWFEKWM